MNANPWGLLYIPTVVQLYTDLAGGHDDGPTRGTQFTILPVAPIPSLASLIATINAAVRNPEVMHAYRDFRFDRFIQDDPPDILLRVKLADGRCADFVVDNDHSTGLLMHHLTNNSNVNSHLEVEIYLTQLLPEPAPAVDVGASNQANPYFDHDAPDSPEESDNGSEYGSSVTQSVDSQDVLEDTHQRGFHSQLQGTRRYSF